MRAQPLLVVLSVVIALALGGAWYASSRTGDAAGAAPAAPGGVLPTAQRPGLPSDGPMAPIEENLAQAAGLQRNDLSAADAEPDGSEAQPVDESTARWIEVVVRAPGSPPGDESLSVLALAAGEDGRANLAKLSAELTSLRSWEMQRKRLAKQTSVAWTRKPFDGGRAKVPLPTDATRASFLLDGRYLFLDAPHEVTLKDSPTSVTLDASAGAYVHLRYELPTNAADRGIDVDGPEGTLKAEGSRLFQRGPRRRPVRYEFDLADGPSFDLRGVHPDSMINVSGKADGLAPLLEMGLRFEPYEERNVQVQFKLGGDLSGRVTDSNGDPIADAELTVAGGMMMLMGAVPTVDTVSDDAGHYQLLGSPTGTLKLEVHAEGWLPTTSEDLEIADGQSVAGYDIVLERGASLAGRVLFASGEPAAGAKLQIKSRAPRGGRSPFSFRSDELEAESDAEGRFQVSGLPEGKADITASLGRTPESGGWAPMGLDQIDEDEDDSPADGLGWRAQAKDVSTGTDNLELVLTELAVLRGTVSDERRQPVSTFQLEAMPSAQSETPWIREGRVQQDVQDSVDGSFELWGLYEGDWALTVSADGYAEHDDSKTEFHIPHTGTPVELVLARAATVSGIVVDPLGQRVRARVIAGGGQRRGPWPTDGVRGTSETDGTFLLEGLPLGSLEIRAESDDWASSAALPVECTAGETVTGMVLTLRVGGVVTGEVYDAQGEPSAGRRVSYSENAMGGGMFGSGPSTTTDSAGAFALEHVTPGTWIITAGMNEKEQLELMTSASDQSAFMEMFAKNDTVTVDVIDGETHHVILGADPIIPVRIRGTVVQKGDPVAGVQVIAVAEDGALLKGMKMASTESNGSFEMTVDRPGAYILTVQGESVGGQTRFPIDVPELDEYSVELSLPSGGIEGRVLTADGKPAPQVQVRLASDAEPQFFDGPGGSRTDAEGHFEFSGLRAGTYTLRAGTVGGAFGSVGNTRYGTSILSDIDVDEDALTRDVDLTLTSACTVQGIVRDEKGNAVDGASIFVRDGQGRLLSPISGTVTNAAGKFEYTGVSPGMVTVSARTKERVSPNSPPVRADTGKTAQVSLTLEAGTTLLIEVVDGEGAPQRAAVHVFDEEGFEVGNMLTMEGMQEMFTEGISTRETKIGPLPSGKYRVEANDTEGNEARKPVTLTGQETRKVKLRLKD